MGLLLELQKRIPDRWLLRRLLPATLFVVIAVVGAGQLGWRHWGDVTLARQRVAEVAQLNGGESSADAAVLLLIAVAAVGCALAVPLAADAIAALVSGAWPWWMTPLGHRVTAWRVHRWASPEDIAREAVRAQDQGKHFRAAHLNARRARSAPLAPITPTWSGDRFRSTETLVKEQTGADIATTWTKLLLVIPDAARTALSDARDAYDAACEALAWSVAFTLLGAWWWPAAPVGLAVLLGSWRQLRRSTTALSHTTETVFLMYNPARTPQP